MGPGNGIFGLGSTTSLLVPWASPSTTLGLIRRKEGEKKLCPPMSNPWDKWFEGRMDFVH